MTNSVIPLDRYAGLHDQITSVVKSTRLAAARSVNVLMTATYWDIGKRIVNFEQGGDERAAYGDALIKRLGDDLSRQFGRGFGWRNLTQMRAFYLSRPAETILQTASAKSEPPRCSKKPSNLLAVLDKHTKCRSDNGYRTWAGSEQGASGFARLCRKLETYKAMLNGLAFRGITGALAVAKTFVQHPVPERSAVSRAEFERRFDGKRDVRESV